MTTTDDPPVGSSPSAGDDANLPLSAVQRAALSALEGLGSALIGRRDPALASTSATATLGSLMFTASAAVVAASIPDCPFAPPGAGLDPKWSSVPPVRLVIRCGHSAAVGGPHCWDGVGNQTTC
jgi:hypothetical protein